MSKRHISKLKQYIADDRPQRFRSYCKKHGLELAEIKLKHGRNLLHYTSKHSSCSTLLRYLLKAGVSGSTIDSQHNTPLHIALRRSLTLEQNGNHEKASLLYTEIILPLIENCPLTLDLQNDERETGRDLLTRLVQLRRLVKNGPESDSGSESSLDNGEEEEEKQWRERLQAEMQDEYHMEWGHLEADCTNIYDERETYDDWAERIRQQYYNKKHAERSFFTYRHDKKKQKSTRDDKNSAHADRFEKRRAEMKEQGLKMTSIDHDLRFLKLRMHYEKRYKELLDREDKGVLRFGDVPWPSVGGKDSDLTVLCERLDKKIDENKKYLRDQRVRWHPDKFSQRFGRWLSEEDRHRIMDRVTVLSQGLNDVVKQLS